jgi:hypothetical protein
LKVFDVTICRLSSYNGFTAGIKVKLTEEEVKYLEEPYRPRPILGHS